MLKNLIASLPDGFKPTVAPALLLAAVCASPLAQAQAQVATGRIGFVYTERLMTDSKMAKAADAKLAAEFSKRQKAVEEMVGKFKGASEKFDAEGSGLAELERTRRARELFNMQKDVERMQREFQEDLQQRKNEELSGVVERANRVIKQIYETEKYDLIVQDAVFASARVDITDKVIKALNSGNPK